MNGWRSILRRTAVAAALAQCACAGNAVVGESDGAGGAGVEGGAGGEPGTGGGSPAGGSGGTGTQSGGAGGTSTLPLQLNDPCDSIGLVRFDGFFTGHIVSATGYIVGFDPPRVIGSTELPVEGGVVRPGAIDRLDLPGDPTCEELRGALAFSLGTDDTGAVQLKKRPLNAIFSGEPQCSDVTVVIDDRMRSFDDVRLYGMLPGSGSVDGPVTMVEHTNTRQGWSGSAWPEFPCSRGYVLFAVARRGAYLAAAEVVVVGQP